MRINSSISLLAQRQMERTTQAISKSLERLSSGKQINSPADDQAAYRMDVRLDSQVRGLRQGIVNINQSQAMLMTAESAIASQIDLVTRMRELAIQAANGTATDAERSDIDRAIQQLFEEYKRITSSTEFNGKKLIDGTFGHVPLQIGSSRDSGNNQLFLDMPDLRDSQIFQQTIGSGSFKSRTTTAAGTNPRFMAEGDINNDGNIDIITSDATNGEISILTGRGDGTFNPRTSFYPTGGAAVAGDVYLKDLDGDRQLDLIIGNYSNFNYEVWMGHGDGTFQYSNSYDGYSPFAVGWSNLEFGDLNEDGILDMITVSSTTGYDIQFFAGLGDGRFATSTTSLALAGTSVEALHLGDINKDGHLDLLYFDGTLGQSHVSLGLGNGTFAASSTTITTSGAPGGLFDLNNDGNLDIVGYSAVYLGTGTGSFGSALSHGRSSQKWLVEDVNADGILDLTSYGSGYRMLGKGDGTFQNTSTLETGISNAVFTDVNNDGVLDFVGLKIQLSVYSAKTLRAETPGSISTSTQSKAENLLTILDDALENLNTERARIGVIHSRLDAAASANMTLADSLQEAKENAMSTDFAEETAELVRNQILQQAQIAVLAQANVGLQIVLKLFNDKESGL